MTSYILLKNAGICYLYEENISCVQALAQDQLRALLDMTRGIDASLNFGIYDGDTSQKQRTWLRENSQTGDLVSSGWLIHEGKTKEASWRKSQLKGLLTLLKEKEGDIFKALKQDLGKHYILQAFRDEVQTILVPL